MQQPAANISVQAPVSARPPEDQPMADAAPSEVVAVGPPAPRSPDFIDMTKNDAATPPDAIREGGDRHMSVDEEKYEDRREGEGDARQASPELLPDEPENDAQPEEQILQPLPPALPAGHAAVTKAETELQFKSDLADFAPKIVALAEADGRKDIADHFKALGEACRAESESMRRLLKERNIKEKADGLDKFMQKVRQRGRGRGEAARGLRAARVQPLSPDR
jgi:hypothetical protein